MAGALAGGHILRLKHKAQRVLKPRGFRDPLRFIVISDNLTDHR
jgi:hypothetical protein